MIISFKMNSTKVQHPIAQCTSASQCTPHSSRSLHRVSGAGVHSVTRDNGSILNTIHIIKPRRACA